MGTKYRKILCGILLVGCVIVFGFYMMMLLDVGIEYPLYDCVTYFDKDGRFQILDVGNTYYLKDALKEEIIGSNIKYYAIEGNDVYFIFQYDEEEYGSLNVISGKYISTTDKASMLKEYHFQKGKMYDLTERPNEFVEYFLKFVPIRVRRR